MADPANTPGGQNQAEPKAGEVQGEGDYVSAKRYQEEQHSFARKEDEVERKAREAEQALDGPQGQELEAAREKAARGGEEEPPTPPVV